MVEKKKYFDVKLEVLNSITQVLGTSQEALQGRVIKFDLTKILKGKNCEAKFVIKLKENELIGEMFSFAIYPSFIRRLIGHNISIVEDSFSCKSQDSILRFKPFLITRKKVHRSVRKTLREETKEFIIKGCEDKTREKVFQAVISGTLQRILSKKLKKTYPLAVCELRVVQVEKEKAK